MTSFTDALVAACRTEWERFENGTRTETQSPQFRHVGEYWQSIGKQLDGRTVVGGIRPAWSSAFISFVVRRAGAGTRFRYAEAHCHYVAKAMELAEGSANNHGYVARKQGAYSPKAGDIIVAGREYAKSYDYDRAKIVYIADSFYPSHGDVVVKVNAGSVETIGGNVKTDTVGRRIRAIGSNGRLKNRVEKGTEYPWIAVLECLL